MLCGEFKEKLEHFIIEYKGYKTLRDVLEK